MTRNNKSSMRRILIAASCLSSMSISFILFASSCGLSLSYSLGQARFVLDTNQQLQQIEEGWAEAIRRSRSDNRR